MSREMDAATLEKMNNLMYYLTKDAARDDFSEYLECLGISFDEYEEFKLELAKIGITRTYV